ncbi:MAG TPA: phosphotransferase [Thermomicrobiales bacterium]|nr:phosphotransferase [Thermomicrobiales bacterium]
MRRLALAALEHYDLHVRRLAIVSYHLNVLYRVETTSGERYALRISHPTWRDTVELRSEVAWLDALARETDIGAHRPLQNRDGALITTVAVEGVPEPRRAVLFTWAPGVQLAERLTDENVEQMGVLSARLHQHGAAWVPPEGFTRRRLNRLFPRDEAVEIFSPRFAHLFSPERRAVFEQGIERAQAELDRLYGSADPPRVVHGDLHHENVLIHRGQLQPVDFEDIINAYPIQDIALTYYDFRYYTNPTTHDYATLCAAFQRGYTRQLPWPQEYENQINILHLARRIWITNWVLTRESPEHHAPFIEREAERFRALME